MCVGLHMKKSGRRHRFQESGELVLLLKLRLRLGGKRLVGNQKENEKTHNEAAGGREGGGGGRAKIYNEKILCSLRA